VTPIRSKTVTTAATAEPLIIRMISLPSGRSAVTSACGRMILDEGLMRRRPSAAAASLWPRGTARIAPRMISA
jgi:hypothetical protein